MIHVIIMIYNYTHNNYDFFKDKFHISSIMNDLKMEIKCKMILRHHICLPNIRITLNTCVN